MSEKYGNAIRNERRHFFPVEFIYHNNHLCECRAIREISFFSLWSFSRATHRGLGVCELYFASTSIYENERERERKGACMSIYTHVYMWTASIVTTCDGRKKRSESNRCIAIAFTYAYSNYIFCVLDPNSRLGRQHK